MNELRRPRDLALLFLAVEGEPPRQRARDQRADVSGQVLRRRVLDRVAALDPEPESLTRAIESIIAESETPGPARASALMFVEEWNQAATNPGLWAYLIARAVEPDDRI